jgi:molybdate transport system ATP-binding protein
VSETLISFRDVSIRVPGEALFPAINFEVKKGEHWAFVGDNEAMKEALLDALAGAAAIVGGQAEFPFFEAHKAAVTHNPFLSPHRLIARIGGRHQFRNLSNTSQFY